jgi:hypothetical protein
MKAVYAEHVNKNGIRVGGNVVTTEGGYSVECSVCHTPMELTDKREGDTWWISCPEYLNGDDEHDSYVVRYVLRPGEEG